MKRFEIGHRYYMFSPCDQDCTWEYEVIKRTAKFITLKPTDEDNLRPENRSRIRRVKVYEFDGEENAKPLGSYSMCPILSAGRGLMA